MTQAIASKAQTMATTRLRAKYKEDYRQFYREAVIELGGKPNRTKQQRIEALQKKLEELQNSEAN